MRRRRTNAYGFAMIEAVLASAIVGGLVVAAISLVGSAARKKAFVADTARARVLCRTLAEEICSRPVGGSGIVRVTINPRDPADQTNGTVSGREAFTTIDQYDNWSSSPPKDEGGTVITGLSGWRREVDVKTVSWILPDVSSVIETGMRRVTVRVLRGQKELARTTFLRSADWEGIQP
ncbi:MAG TPA: hypothetical protein ENJ00_07825 [Phycisphaerales bacterium]|nr:hypothetical protein [Phycisphaerales bacterium]